MVTQKVETAENIPLSAEVRRSALMMTGENRKRVVYGKCENRDNKKS